MTIKTSNTNFQHFSGSGIDTVEFARTINAIIIDVTGNVVWSLDGGTNFMPICEGTHQFDRLNHKEISFDGTGSYSGVGMA